MLLGYHGRIEVVILKVAMIYEAVRITDKGFDSEVDDLVISGDTMKEAIDLAKYFSTSIFELLTGEFKFTRFSQQLSRLESMLLKNGNRMHKSAMLRNSNWSKRDFDEVLETAVASGLMVVEKERQLSGQKKDMVRLLSR